MIHLGSQPVDPVNRGLKVFDCRPQHRLFLPDLFKRAACGGERSEVKTHVGTRPGHRCPEGPACDDDIGNQRRVAVGRQPLQVPYGIDSALAEHGRGLGGVHGGPVYRLLPFQPRIQPESGAESRGR